MPIYEKKEEILETLKNNLFCIVTGETGSGKTTQIAQYARGKAGWLWVFEFLKFDLDELNF